MLPTAYQMSALLHKIAKCNVPKHMLMEYSKHQKDMV